MSDRFHIEGEWPSPVVIRTGWSKSLGRPWNDEHRDVAIRLDRGGPGFLRRASEYLQALAGGSVFSPALLGLATRVWLKAGYLNHVELDVMERSLRLPLDSGSKPTSTGEVTDYPTLGDIDNRAFEGFWRIGVEGIKEAVAATPLARVVLTGNEQGPVGYAVVGVQSATSYLQRIAVLPDFQGSGFGVSLLASSIGWARQHGAKTMVLNVRGGAGRARDLYLRSGFALTSSKLRVLRFDA